VNEAQRSLRPPSSTTVCLRPRPLVFAAVRPVYRCVTCATRRLSARGGAPSLDRRVQNQTGREVRGGPSSVQTECNPVGRRRCIEIEAAKGHVHRHRRRLQLGRGRPCRGRRARRVNAVLLSAMACSRRHRTLPRSTNPPPPPPQMTTRGRLAKIGPTPRRRRNRRRAAPEVPAGCAHQRSRAPSSTRLARRTS
jgi:hypothetical protein